MAYDFRLPNAYRSIDFKVFESSAKLQFGAIKKNIDLLSYLNSPSRCPDHILPLLAEKVGMPYFSETIPYVNRQILKSWWWAIQNKGTEISIRLMTCFAVMSFVSRIEDIASLMEYYSAVDVYFKVDKYESLYDDEGNQLVNVITNIRGYIEVLYELVPGVDQTEQEARILRFINYVRPAGWRILFKPSLIQKEGVGDGKELIIMAGVDEITQSPEPYTKPGHSYVVDKPSDSRAEYGVDFSEVSKNNNPND